MAEYVIVDAGHFLSVEVLCLSIGCFVPPSDVLEPREEVTANSHVRKPAQSQTQPSGITLSHIKRARSNMKAYLSWMLPFKYSEDDREPLFELSSPLLGPGKFGFFAPEILYWVEVLGAIACLGAFAAVLSVVSYKFIIQRQGTVLSYVVGFGFLIPLWIMVPLVQLQLFDIRHKVMKFCIGAICPTLGIFHTSEAMFGCAPAHTTRSIADYAMYWGSPIVLVFDKGSQKYVKAGVVELLGHLWSFVFNLVLLGIIQSYLSSHKFEPNELPDAPWYSLSRFLNPAQVSNNFVLGLMMQSYMTTYVEGLIATTILFTGCKCEKVMDNPVLMSTTPSDFWVVRWNTLVQGVLKRGVYIPMRKLGSSKVMAVVGTFLASGLFHEWLLSFIFLVLDSEKDSEGNCADCFEPFYGGATVFMLYMALIIGLEKTIGNWSIFCAAKKNLPQPILTMCMLALGLPVGHWFMEPYTTSDFFIDGGVALPMIKPL